MMRLSLSASAIKASAKKLVYDATCISRITCLVCSSKGEGGVGVAVSIVMLLSLSAFGKQAADVPKNMMIVKLSTGIRQSDQHRRQTSR